MSGLRRYLRLWLIIFLCWMVVRCFFFQVIYIPSGSMKGTLREGDYVLVNKLAYGGRLPMTPLAIPFTEESIYLDWITIPYCRVPGYTDVSRNDVIVFNLPSETHLPVDIRTRYIKRCVGLPGDNLVIRGGQVLVGDNALEIPPLLLQRYAVAFSTTLPDSIFQRLGIMDKAPAGMNCNLYLTPDQAKGLQACSGTTTVSPDFVQENQTSTGLFPQNTYFTKWNLDHYGPLWIPAEGKSIVLNDSTVALYQKAITLDEERKLEKRNGSFYIDGKLSTTYTFTQDYYFVLGDNRYDSNDSRYWGFVPVSHLIGKASFLLYSSGEELPGSPGSFSSIR